MITRDYKPADKAGCLKIFDSNCPLYFDPAERSLFESWLVKQGTGIPAQTNSAGDHYYIFEQNEQIIGCAGFYLLKDQKIATLAWGMIHADYHKQGYGSHSFRERKVRIHNLDPDLKIALSTSQHTYGFYERMGFKVTGILPQGFGPDLDRYDMVQL